MKIRKKILELDPDKVWKIIHDFEENKQSFVYRNYPLHPFHIVYGDINLIYSTERITIDGKLDFRIGITKDIDRLVIHNISLNASIDDIRKLYSRLMGIIKKFIWIKSVYVNFNWTSTVTSRDKRTPSGYLRNQFKYMFTKNGWEDYSSELRWYKDEKQKY